MRDRCDGFTVVAGLLALRSPRDSAEPLSAFLSRVPKESCVISRRQAKQGPVTLSPRQMEVLRWTALGKTTWETAIIMSCATATVNYHLKQIFKKLDVTSKTHAVARAIGKGLLQDN